MTPITPSGVALVTEQNSDLFVFCEILKIEGLICL